MSRLGAGTVVNAAPQRRTGTAMSKPEDAGRSSSISGLGIPDLDLFPRAAWVRATRAVLGDAAGRRPRLHRPTRSSATARRARGLSRASARREHRPRPRRDLQRVRPRVQAGRERVARKRGGRVRGRRTRATRAARPNCSGSAPAYRGIEVDDCRASTSTNCRPVARRLVVVTPAHQFPTGAVLSPARRTALAAWARDVDGYVIEDDYDAEYRYDRHPVGAFQGVAPDRVALQRHALRRISSPGMRLGWLVLPPPLVEPIMTSRRITDHAVVVAPPGCLRGVRRATATSTATSGARGASTGNDATTSSPRLHAGSQQPPPAGSPPGST